MKKIIGILIVLLILPSLCFAGVQNKLKGVISLKNTAAAATCQGANPADCAYRETFDGASACYSGDATFVDCDITWSAVSGTTTFKSTDFPGGVPQGTYNVTATNVNPQAVKAITAADSYYATAIVSSSAVTTLNLVLALRDSGGTRLCGAGWTGSHLETYNGATEHASTGTTVAINTKYYLRILATKGTGDNAVCEAWIGTDSTFATYSDHVSSTNGTWTNQIAQVYWSGRTGIMSVDSTVVASGKLEIFISAENAIDWKAKTNPIIITNTINFFIVPSLITKRY